MKAFKQQDEELQVMDTHAGSERTQSGYDEGAPPLPQLDPEMSRADAGEVAESFEAEMDGEEMTPEESEERASRMMREIAQQVGQSLQRRAEERVALRQPVEQRWLEDLRQYHSQYDPELLEKIRDAKGSEVFVNITAPKTDGFSARMADMILPTDGKNWAIKPTPVPQLMDAMSSEEPMLGADGQPMTTPEGAVVQQRDVARGITEAVRQRCAAMEREMDDQLSDTTGFDYNASQRQGIDQCAQLGTMVLKGPTVLGRTRKVWKKVSDETGIAHVMEIVEDKRPAVEWVDLWNFFPDMTSADPRSGEDIYQRHYKTKRDLRALAKQPGFDNEAIRKVLKEDRRPTTTATHLQQLRDIAGEYQTTNLLSLYEVWEYHGPMGMEELAACGVDFGDKEIDPLETLDAVIWFCEGAVLKAMLKDSDPSEALGYHVTWVKKDETSPFGYGIPRLMRNSQNVANAAWRMVMDNAGLALAPQIIMAMGVVPADGKWDLYAGKVWIAKEGVIDVRQAMLAFDMPIRLKELMLIFETALKLADEETSMSIIMQGQNGPAVPETAEGMAMLFAAASVVQRRFVRLYDDRITKPIITGVYGWNMEFNPKEEIKGDYSVLALGSSALLEKERFSQNVLAALNLCASPIIEPRVDVHVIVEEAFKVLRLGHAVKDRASAEEEIAKRAQQAQQAAAAEAAGKGGTPKDPNVIAKELELKEREIAAREAKNQQDGQIHKERMAIDIQKLSAQTGLKEQDLLARLGMKKMDIDADNQRFNTEIAIKQKQGTGI